MKSVLVGVLVLIAPLTGAPAATVEGEPPLADAGLDQQTTVGATVQLDATGSRDPNGSITAYNWTIEAPNGSRITPACRSCGRTSFRPFRIGQYNVSVTVTDDEGHTHADTLYLTAQPGSGPSVDVAGPENPIVGTNATYTADSTAGNVPLDRIEWRRNGSSVGNQSLSGEQQTVDHGFSFSEQGQTNVTAIVVDVAGQQANASMTVEPRTASRGGNGGGGCCRGYYDPLADGGTGEYIQSNEDGQPIGPSSAADAYNYVQNNGVASTAYINPGDSQTGSADPRPTRESGSDALGDGSSGNSDGNDGGISNGGTENEGGTSGSSGYSSGGNGGGISIGGISIF